MTAAGAHFLYDPHETLDQFRSRQAHAYAAGRRAWQERRIRGHLLPFYEALIRYVGQNQYAWVKEQTLAAEFAVHVATIKRWLAKLEAASLIRRQRRFATSSLTYVTAYDQEQGGRQENTDNHCSHHTPDQCNQSSEQIPVVEGGLVKNDYRQISVAEDGTHSAPTFGADLHPDSIKSQHLTSVGGNTDPNTQAVDAVLDREGVSDFVVAHRLHQLDWAELHAIQSYLNHQRNVQDRPRLFAWLATHGFGAQLLQGMPQRDRRRRTRHATNDPLQYVSGPLATLIQGHAPDEPPAAPRHAPDESPAAPRRVPDHDTGLAPPAAAPPPAELWPAVLATLRETCPAAEWTTWLEPTALLLLTDTTAVVGTPNVFVRDTVRDHYCSLLHGAVQGCLGGARTIEVVIGSG